MDLDDTNKISSPEKCRKGWEESFELMHNNNDDELLDKELIDSEFDNKEWIW